MSQVASAYIVPEIDLKSAVVLIRGGKDAAFWSAIEPFEAPGKFDYSGFVVAILIAFLGERGVELPFDDTDSDVATLIDAGLVAASTVEQSAAVLAAINELPVSDAEMATYFEEFTEERWEEAGKAMRAAYTFITDALVRQINAGGRYLLFVG